MYDRNAPLERIAALEQVPCHDAGDNDGSCVVGERLLWCTPFT